MYEIPTFGISNMRMLGLMGTLRGLKGRFRGFRSLILALPNNKISKHHHEFDDDTIVDDTTMRSFSATEAQLRQWLRCVDAKLELPHDRMLRCLRCDNRSDSSGSG
jgi:hypothetical protein